MFIQLHLSMTIISSDPTAARELCLTIVFQQKYTVQPISLPINQQLQLLFFSE